jgi:hypothetical protein
MRAKKTEMDKYTAESLRMSKVYNVRDSRHQLELDDIQKINEQVRTQYFRVLSSVGTNSYFNNCLMMCTSQFL